MKPFEREPFRSSRARAYTAKAIFCRMCPNISPIKRLFLLFVPGKRRNSAFPCSLALAVTVSETLWHVYYNRKKIR